MTDPLNSQALSSLTAALAQAVGPTHVLTDPADLAPFLDEERGHYKGSAQIVVRPGTTDETAAVVRLCAEHAVSIVPQGGNTGLVGGAVAEADQIILSLGRLNTVRAVDPLNGTMTVEAGCILGTIHQKAEEAGLLFPLSLAAEGSCQIGGNISTNAGGVNVLRYGNTRDLVLGLEVVLPDGRIWNGLRALRKDNTGYDLKHLFIGAEGTLGIITAAVLKLFPAAKSRETAFVAMDTVDQAAELFARARTHVGEALVAFEIIPRIAIDFVTRHQPGCHDPFAASHAQYVLIELTSPRFGSALREGLETLLGDALEQGLVADAVLAESEAQRQDLWQLREAIPEAQKKEGVSIKHDVAVPVARIAEFLNLATARVEAELPGIRPCPFGHMGDGNIHFNLSQPVGMDRQEYLDMWEHFNRIVHDLVADMGGSFSAEHGIGQLRAAELAHYKSDVEMDLMRTIKSALDPNGRMNPSKIIGPAKLG